MAAAIKLLATQMEAMEASFLSVFFEAANKIANLTDSKLFFLMESSDGVRKVGGHKELKLAYELGELSSLNNDIEINDKAFEGSTPTPSVESFPDSNNRKRKMNHPLEKQTGSKSKYCREDVKCQETSVVKMEEEKEEEEAEEEEEEDVDASPNYDDDLVDQGSSDDEREKSRGSTDKTKGS